MPSHSLDAHRRESATLPRRRPLLPRKVDFSRRLQVEPLETRCMLSGVTLITHGFNSNADGWVTAMAQAIGDRPDLNIDQALYRLEVTDPGHDNGPLEVTSAWLSGPLPTDPLTEDPEIALVLDWSDVAGTAASGWYTRSTYDVAAAVAEALVAADFLAELSQPLASLPLHFIGHSRGGSLVDELAHQIGLRGIWVDQVTTLDPHPVDGINDPFDIDYGDAPMVAWDNVVYWDNYWRESDELFDFSGESVANVHNVHLDDAILETGGYSYEHSDVHLWYYGTIDTSEDPPANNGDEDVPNDWYGGVHPDRLASGYAYSRPVNGTREQDGLTAELPGGSAGREPVDLTLPAWANVLDLHVAAPDTTFVDGEVIPLDYYQQDADSAATITFALDADRNPFNSNHQDVFESEVSPTVSLLSGSAELPTINVPTGTYYVLTTITDSTGQTRYSYAPQQVVIDNPFVNLPPSDILLDATSALENVTSYAIGHVTVVDPNVGDRHTFVVSDERFEVVDAVLKLKSDQSLSFDTEPQVELDLTAIDSGQLALDPPKHFVITVTPNPFPWHNLFHRLDVSDDDFVSPIDALRIINELNDPRVSSAIGELPHIRPAEAANYYDVYADGFVSPLDVLVVINNLNRRGEGEGESALGATIDAAILSPIDVLPVHDSRFDRFAHHLRRRGAVATDMRAGWDQVSSARICAWDAVEIRDRLAAAIRHRREDVFDVLQSTDDLRGHDLEDLLEVLVGDLVRHVE